MKKSIRKGFSRVLAGCLATVITAVGLPVAAQGTGETEEPVLLYENPFDVDTGLIHISSVETDLQEWGIVEMDGRTVLKMSGLKGNPNEFAIIDTNADLPAEAVAEFDMKLEPVDDGVGGTSAKGGFDFGVQLNETQTAVERQTWFAAENLNKFRIRTTGQGDIYLDSQNVKHNVWQHWRIEYKGNSLTVYIDDKKSYEGGLPGNVPAQAGLAGFMMWSEGNTYVDDLKVYEYQSKPLPDYGSDEELENAVSIGNDQLEVMVDKTFPQVLNYTLKETEGKIFAGRPKAEHTAYLTDDTAQEGTAYSAEVTQFTTTADAAEYTLHMEDFHGGLDVNYRIAVEGNEVVKTITDISGAGEPYLVSIKLDTPILRVKEVQNPQIAHNTERSPDRFSNYVGDQDADVIGALSQQGEGTSLTDWAFLYTDSVLGTAYNTLIDIPYEFEVAVDSEGKYAALYDREYYYRLAYLPNEDADGEKHLGELTLYDTGEPFESRVLITGDANENGMMDWQDGANWVRSQLPEISEELKAFMDAGGTWQQCHGTFPNNPTSSDVKIPYDVYASEARKTYYLTDGAPQVYAIAGWQQHGHDWRWGDWEQPISPGAGGYEGALSAWEETLKYGSFISFHVNQEICVPEADSYDTNMVARQNDGSERLYTSVFGQGTFRVKSYFLDWAAGNTKARMDKFFDEQFWAPVILYNDQLWDNVSPYNGVYGIHESYAKKKIIETYLEHGVNVVTEGFQPTNLRNGLVQWKYHDMSSLISNYVIAGYGSAQMQSNDPYFQIFGAKVSSNARNGNIMSTPDFDKAVTDHYLYAAPTSYLRQFTAQEYIDNEEMSAVRWTDGEKTVYSKYIKASNSLEFTEDGVVILQGNDRFLPDLTTPESKIHVYSESGMAKEWTLPAYWNGIENVDLYELTASGKAYIERIPVEDGKVLLQCSAKVPYIIVPAEGEEATPGAVNMALDAQTDATQATDGSLETAWTGEAGSQIELRFDHEYEFNRVEIAAEGVTGYRMEAEKNGEWSEVFSGTSLPEDGRIVFPSVQAEALRLVITNTEGQASIKAFGAYADGNLALTATPSASSAQNYTTVHEDDRGVEVSYTHHGDAYSAADDSLETVWQAGGAENQYLDMSFNHPSRVNRVVIFEEGENVTSFRIQGYVEGNWIDLYEGSSIGAMQEIDFPVATVEKVRLLIENANNAPRIQEFRVYGVGLVNETAIAKGNIALNKPAEQSSTYTASLSPAVASRAVDGNTNPDWNAQSISATEAEECPWWKVDLEETHPINVIKLYARNLGQNRLGNVDISILDENGETVWTYYLEKEPNLSTAIQVEDEEGNPVNGRYVMIQRRAGGPAAQLEIAECEVYEDTGEVDIVDKTGLQELYNDCQKYEEKWYTEESWATFTAAMEKADEVLKDTNATNFDVENANRDLFYARERLDEKPGDVGLLQELIEKAEAEAARTDVYTAESLEVLDQAIQRAKSDMETIVTLREVTEAMERLQEAIDQLEILPEPVNKTLLQQTYEYGLKQDTTGVAESAVEYFQKAMENAKAVLDNENATQAEVNKAWDDLLEAIWGLGINQGDKTLLNLLITKAEEMEKNADKYVETHWQELLDALKAAKEVSADGDALQSEVDEAANALHQAILLQRYKANKENLEELINKANGMDLSGYTLESVTVFKAALENAKLVLADESLSEDDQKIVDSAVEELSAAIKQLSTSEEPSNPDDSDKEEDSSEKPDEGEKPDSPATGDNSNGFLWFAVVFAGLMAAVLVITQRKKSMNQE